VCRWASSIWCPKFCSSLESNRCFTKLRSGPGRPMWFGIGPQRPGGVRIARQSGFDTRLPDPFYVIPAIAEAMGTKRALPERLALAARVTFQHPLAYFLPVAIEHDDWGRPWANPRRPNGSGDFLSLTGTDGFVGIASGAKYLSQRLRHHGVPLVTTIDFRRAPHSGTARPLDRLGRPLHDLRISVMDRCNFRCPYCMPKEQFHEHYRFLKSQERLSFDEIVRLARLFAALGCAKIAAHGRRTAAARKSRGILVGDLTDIPGIEDIALTTNGVLLGQHAVDLHANGLRRVNRQSGYVGQGCVRADERRVRGTRSSIERPSTPPSPPA